MTRAKSGAGSEGAAGAPAPDDLIQMGHWFSGEPFMVVPGALPDLPKSTQIRHWAILDILMRKRAITAREISRIHDQTTNNFTIYTLRREMGWNILRDFSKRQAEHFDSGKDVTRNDIYFLDTIFRDYVLSKLGGIEAWHDLVPEKARNAYKQFGMRMSRKMRERAQEFHDIKIDEWARGVKKPTEMQRRDSDHYNRAQTKLHAPRRYPPRRRPPDAGQSSFAF